MTKIVFTVDVDRDVAWPEQGSHKAGSRHSSSPSFDSTRKGFFALLSLANRLKIPTTFFFEAATALELGPVSLGRHEAACHGFDHEDFTGELTGKPFTKEKAKETLKAAKASLEKKFGSNINGFRAPYLKWNRALLEALAEAGFAYDSSVVEGTLAKPPLPELFLPEWRDSNGRKMSGYLWPLMEGKRKPEEYVKAVGKAVVKKQPYVVLSTHSWHTHCSVEKGALSAREAESRLGLVEKVLEGIGGLPGTTFCTGFEAISRQPKAKGRKKRG